MRRDLPDWIAEAAAERGGWLPAEATRRAAGQAGWSTEELARGLLPRAAEFAHAPISGYSAGAIALVATGEGEALALGANLEHAGAPLTSVVHAEQAALHVARRHGAGALRALALTAPPCGHCRQFLLEAEADAGVRILTPDGDATLGELLPRPFGPGALGRGPALFRGARARLRLRDGSSDALVLDALEAARAAYAPYSRAPAGAALLGADGRTHCGSALESVACNPSLGALAAALSALALARAAGTPPAAPARAVLVEAAGRSSQRAQAEALLAAAAPRVALEFHAAEQAD